MEPNQGIRTWQWVVTVIVIIVLIVIGILVFGGKGSQAPTTGTETPSPTSQATGAVNRITMTDQYPGNVVYLSSVQLAQPGWVVVQKDNNGTPGDIIGSAHFDAGINPGGKITLTKPLIDGATYYAVIYTDDGTGTFNTTGDQPLKDDNGSIIMQIFHGSSSVGAGLKG